MLNDYSTISFPARLWLIHFRSEGDLIHSIVKRIFKKESIVSSLGHTLYVLVDTEDITAYELVEILESEAMTTVRVAIGGVCHTENDVKLSMDQVEKLLEIGQTIDRSQSVFQFEAYQVAYHILSDFQEPRHILLEDEVLLNTAKVFLESNLNVTDAAVKLYVHRNTLLYRISKIHSITGYDLRSFKDASNFYFLLQLEKIPRPLSLLKT